MTPPAKATLPLLHLFLGIGQLLLFGGFAVARQLGFKAEVDGSAAFQNGVVYVTGGVALLMLFVAYFILKPRAPRLRQGQSVQEYWTTPGAMVAVRVWFVCEGASIFAVMGYFLTGAPVAVTVTAIAIVAYWLLGPNAFAKP